MRSEQRTYSKQLKDQSFVAMVDGLVLCLKHSLH